MDDDIDDLVAYVKSEEVQKAAADHIASLSDEELAEIYAKLRDSKGRFIKGGNSPNPNGRRGKDKLPRLVTQEQAVADLLELMEQPVQIRKGGRKQTVPAIRAIYDRLIHKAVDGDWNAIKLCVGLREKYSGYRTDSVVKLKEHADAVRLDYEMNNKEMPANVQAIVDLIDRRVDHLTVNAQLEEAFEAVSASPRI